MQSNSYITGVDEVGRGALAGPVLACAVSLPLYSKNYLQNRKFLENLYELKDSKLLTPKKRKTLFNLLTSEACIDYAIGSVSHKVIDKINIHEATFLAMKKALLNLKKVSPEIYIDGAWPIKDMPPELKSLKQLAIPKGDRFHTAIMAASVIAKVTRDELMEKLSKKYPFYDLEKHKGYGTKLHYEKIASHGISPIHRASFNLTNKRKND